MTDVPTTPFVDATVWAGSVSSMGFIVEVRIKVTLLRRY